MFALSFLRYVQSKTLSSEMSTLVTYSYALEELTNLRCWFYKRELQRSSCAIREISVPISILNRIETLIR